MLSRLLVIITCVSLVGVTVVPASAIPCCCNKSMHSRGMSRAKAEMSAVCCPESADKAHSCCHGKLETACRSKKIVRQNCPRCRCLEQLQIIALSGYAPTENNIRVSTVTLATVAPMPFTDFDKSAVVMPSSDCRDPIISLRTCTLRC